MSVHILTIPLWRPVYLNELVTVHWRVAHRRKKADAAMIAASAIEQGISKATGKRSVALRIYSKKHGRCPDEDGVWKSLLDGLKRAGQLLDDSRRWCERGSFTFVTWGEHQGQHKSIITLTDLD